MYNYKKVSFVLSGGGSNLLQILKKNLTYKDFEVVTIISNNKISNNIKSFIKKFYKGVILKEKQKKLNKKIFFDTDIIFSVGYMKTIDKSIISNFDVLNLHPSILPTYKGLMTQKRMLINNEKKYGFTIHKVASVLDEGKIISNKIRKIVNKNESDLLNKHKNLEHQYVYEQFVKYILN